MRNVSNLLSIKIGGLFLRNKNEVHLEWYCRLEPKTCKYQKQGCLYEGFLMI